MLYLFSCFVNKDVEVCIFFFIGNVSCRNFVFLYLSFLFSFAFESFSFTGFFFFFGSYGVVVDFWSNLAATTLLRILAYVIEKLLLHFLCLFSCILVKGDTTFWRILKFVGNVSCRNFVLYHPFLFLFIFGSSVPPVFCTSRTVSW